MVIPNLRSWDNRVILIPQKWYNFAGSYGHERLAFDGANHVRGTARVERCARIRYRVRGTRYVFSQNRERFQILVFSAVAPVLRSRLTPAVCGPRDGRAPRTYCPTPASQTRPECATRSGPFTRPLLRAASTLACRGTGCGGLARSGVFRLRGVLVGTIAYQTYAAMLGVRLRGALTQTSDVDVAQFLSVSIAVQDQTDSMEKVLQEIDPTFRKIPAWVTTLLPNTSRVSGCASISSCRTRGRTVTSPCTCRRSRRRRNPCVSWTF